MLADVSLVVEPGQSVAIAGANGAGKTTLLRVVAGILEAEHGTVRVCGLEVGQGSRAYYSRLGVVSAGNTALYARLSTRQHLQFAARIAGLDRQSREPAARQMVDRFALDEFGARRVDRLSMGQRQRLRLALAFLHQPSLVLLDEPATSLDSLGREMLAATVTDHMARGGSAVWFGPSGEQLPIAPTRQLELSAGSLVAVPR